MSIPQDESLSADTLKLWRHIFGGQRGLLAVWTAKRASPAMEKGSERTRFFEYPREAEDALSHALAESEAGREAYFCVHLLTKQRRVKENASEVVSLWGESDGGEILENGFKPTALVESSPGHFHIYYRLTDAVPPEVAEGLNKRLARRIGADPSGFDLTQLLRVPGTTNHKYEERPVVKILSLDAGRSYSPAELDEMLPGLEETKNATGRAFSSEPPVMLDSRGLRVWNGEDPKLADSGKIDRSGSLVKVGRVLYDTGANRDVIERALEERDNSLGWNKYTGRRDAAKCYSDIVSELEKNGRNRQARITVGNGRGNQEEPRAEAPKGGGEAAHAPEIQINNRHLRDVTADTLEALEAANDPPEMFIRAGALVRVREDEHGTPQIQSMDLNHVRGRADRCADFVRITKQGDNWIKTKVNPPEIVIKDLMALPTWPFPALEAVVESPILRPDGSIFDAPGYDAKTRLYYRPVPGFEHPRIPADPSEGEVRAALDLVNEAVGEFPYADRASAANTLGLLVTLLIRQAIPGPVPLALVDAPQAGTGKTLLAEIVAMIGTGRAGEMLGAPRDDEEWRKQITSKFSAGGTTIIVDNVENALYSPSLARALTSRTWTDRVLGRSEMVTVSQRATWIATGNNITLRGDLPRRCYWIRLDAKESRPWKRERFKHPNLTLWVEKSRGELVGAVLTIARAWHAAGKPKAEGIPRLGSFEAWAEIVGGILAFAGIEGFLGNLEELYSKADEGNAEWEAFLEEWWRQRGEDPITVKDLAKLIEEKSSLKDALPGDLSEALDKGEGSFTRRLGKAIAKRAGTRYGDEGLHIEEAGELRRAKLWSIRDSSGECEFVSFVSLYNPSASKNVCNDNIQAEGNRAYAASGGPEENSTNSQTHTGDAEEWEGEF